MWAKTRFESRRSGYEDGRRAAREGLRRSLRRERELKKMRALKGAGEKFVCLSAAFQCRRQAQGVERAFGRGLKGKTAGAAASPFLSKEACRPCRVGMPQLCQLAEDEKTKKRSPVPNGGEPAISPPSLARWDFVARPRRVAPGSPKIATNYGAHPPRTVPRVKGPA